ncbi:phage tail sheath family protein [Nonomuraea glycinis]|uniref:phage tail sheath family protein n=1 Tax=Nonomuraea glycinis TaxID=2047744 RepID=UPI0033AE230F
MSEPMNSPGVYWREKPPGSVPIEGVGTAVAAFIGFAVKPGPGDPILVTSWNQYVDRFGGFAEGCYLPQAVYGYFLNGGSACYVIRLGADGAQSAEPAPAPAPKAQAILGPFRIIAKQPAPGGRAITAEVTEVPTPEGERPPEDRFTLTVKRGNITEPIEISLKGAAKDFVGDVAKGNSKLVTVELMPGKDPVKPAPQTVTLQVAELEPKSDAELEPAPAPALPAQMTPDMYVGSARDRRGLGGLEAVDEVTMIAIPDLMSALERNAIDEAGVKGVQGALIAHCANLKDRMAILDPPPGLSADDIKAWRIGLGDSEYATLYYPWLKVANPDGKGEIRIPPSGHMAGIWARSDATRGVHKAPANEVVRGAIALETQLTLGEQNDINPANVNCIRVMPGRGIRVWGARTLSSEQWKYLNVRRLFNYLQESILNGTQWVVFEPNDDALWARIRRTISAFLVMEWHRGALFGLTPDEAFYVKCDRDTNPAESIEQGMVVCEIGVAPVKPAEFVVFQVAQMASGVSLVSE